jgi:hypothetical protein
MAIVTPFTLTEAFFAEETPIFAMFETILAVVIEATLAALKAFLAERLATA